jgi:hypothetical protein
VIVRDWSLLWSTSTATVLNPLPPTKVTLDVDSYVDGAITQTKLQNERKYFFLIRLTNILEQRTVFSSNGKFMLSE